MYYRFEDSATTFEVGGLVLIKRNRAFAFRFWGVDVATKIGVVLSVTPPGHSFDEQGDDQYFPDYEYEVMFPGVDNFVMYLSGDEIKSAEDGII